MDGRQGAVAPIGTAAEQNGCGVLVLHGLSGPPNELRFIIGALESQGYYVAAPKLESAYQGSWQCWTGAVQAAYESLAQKVSAIHVTGQGAGALLALDLLSRGRDDLRTAALYSPTLCPNGWAVPALLRLLALAPMPVLARYMEAAKSPLLGLKDDRIRRFVVQELASTTGLGQGLRARQASALVELMRLARDLRPRLGQIDRPMFIVHARDDDQSSLDNAFAIQRRVAGPVETLVLEDSFHLVTLDRQRHLVAERTIEFLDRHTRAGLLEQPGSELQQNALA